MTPRQVPLRRRLGLAAAATGAMLAVGLGAAMLSARSTSKFPLESLAGLELVNVKGEAAVYRGRRAVRLLDTGVPENAPAGGHTMAIVAGSDFEDGTIEIELAGAPRVGAADGMRGFIGVAFHLQDHGERFECFYLRPTNGRADDQLRRNHSTQYISHPGFPFDRSRKESPGVYESYVDLEPGAWTKIKIVVAGVRARLFINGTVEPCLIVNDLKLGKTRGQIALWVGQDTDGYFSRLSLR